MFKCDQARISRPCDKWFLILGWNANTAKDREKNPDAGRWIKDGEPYDFDYVREEVVASGDTEAELIASAKHYKRLLGMTMENYLRELCSSPNAGGVPRPESAPTPKQSTPEKL